MPSRSASPFLLTTKHDTTRKPALDRSTHESQKHLGKAAIGKDRARLCRLLIRLVSMAERSFYHCFASKRNSVAVRLYRTRGTRDFETLTTTTIKKYPTRHFRAGNKTISCFSVYMVDFDIFPLLSWNHFLLLLLGCFQSWLELFNAEESCLGHKRLDDLFPLIGNIAFAFSLQIDSPPLVSIDRFRAIHLPHKLLFFS